MKEAIVLVLDENYVEHGKALMVNCRNEGQWQGDFCVVTNTNFGHKGITVHRIACDGFFAKFHLFDTFFRQWDRCLYLDCDCIVQLPLTNLMTQLDGGGLVMAKEVGTVLGNFQAWDQDRENQSHKDELERLKAEYPFVVDHLAFNTSCVIWRPEYIPEDTVSKLHAVQLKCSLINAPGEHGVDHAGLPHPGGTDQQIVNLVLYDHISEVQDKAFCFWAFDTEQHYEEERCPVVVHYGRWYAPWIVKTPPMAAYKNERLGVVCHEFYQKNLRMFDGSFQ